MPPKSTSVDFPGIGATPPIRAQCTNLGLNQEQLAEIYERLLANSDFTDELKAALRKEGLPVRDSWQAVDGSFAEGEPIHIPDDTAARLESRRLCMMCAILLGSVLLMAILGAAAFADSLEITKRLTALLYGEVV
jgi:hypothetical protein